MSVTFYDRQEAKDYITRKESEGLETRMIDYGKKFVVELTGKKYKEKEYHVNELGTDKFKKVYHKIHNKPQELSLLETVEVSMIEPQEEQNIVKISQSAGEAIDRLLTRRQLEMPYVVLINKDKGWELGTAENTKSKAIASARLYGEGTEAVVYDTENDKPIYYKKPEAKIDYALTSKIYNKNGEVIHTAHGDNMKELRAELSEMLSHWHDGREIEVHVTDNTTGETKTVLGKDFIS